MVHWFGLLLLHLWTNRFLALHVRHDYNSNIHNYDMLGIPIDNLLDYQYQKVNLHLLHHMHSQFYFQNSHLWIKIKLCKQENNSWHFWKPTYFNSHVENNDLINSPTDIIKFKCHILSQRNFIFCNSQSRS